MEKEKLKTLKEIEYFESVDGEGYKHAVDRNRLRAEAIKRARFYKKQRDSFNRDTLDWMYWCGQMRAELYAHDLTEEDLE